MITVPPSEGTNIFPGFLSEELHMQKLHGALDSLSGTYCTSGEALISRGVVKLAGEPIIHLGADMTSEWITNEGVQRIGQDRRSIVRYTEVESDFDPYLILQKVKQDLLPHSAGVIRAQLRSLNTAKYVPLASDGVHKSLAARSEVTIESEEDKKTFFGVLEVVLHGRIDTTLTYGGKEAKVWSKIQRPAVLPSATATITAAADGSGVIASGLVETSPVTAAIPPGAARQHELSAEDGLMDTNSPDKDAPKNWSACFGDVYRAFQVPFQALPGIPGHIGVRVSLMYSLHLDGDCDPHGSNSLLSRACTLQSAIQDALRDPTFLPEGGKLGYLFQNTYQEAVLSKAVTKLEQDGRLVTALDLPFKDEDSVVVTVLATVSGLALRPLRPIACDTSGYATITANEMFVIDSIPTQKEAAGFGQFGALGQSLDQTTSHAVNCYAPDHLNRRTKGAITDVEGPIAWMGSQAPKLHKWVSLWKMGTFSKNDFCTCSAMVASIPSYRERQAGIAEDDKRPTLLTVEQIQPFKTLKRKAEAASGSSSNGEGTGVKKKKTKGSGAVGSGAPTPAVPLTSPPLLYSCADPSLMTAAQKKASLLNTERIIHVTGGQGRVCEAAAEGSDLREGKASLTLNPGQGPTELKALIKKTFGKLKKFKVGQLLLLDSDGRAASSNAKAEDLTQGVHVRCTYIQAEGSFGGMSTLADEDYEDY